MSREDRQWQWTAVIALAIIVLAMLLKSFFDWLGR